MLRKCVSFIGSEKFNVKKGLMTVFSEKDSGFVGTKCLLLIPCGFNLLINVADEKQFQVINVFYSLYAKIKII
jgi:hypothetical protein